MVAITLTYIDLETGDEVTRTIEVPEWLSDYIFSQQNQIESAKKSLPLLMMN